MKKLGLFLALAIAVFLLGTAAMAFVRWHDHWFIPLFMALLIANTAIPRLRARNA